MHHKKGEQNENKIKTNDGNRLSCLHRVVKHR